MEDIKVGDYIRTPYSTIEKVERIDEPDDNIYDYMVLTDISAYGLRFLKNNKTKHSPNIIDLIEVGDYVNGVEVIDKYKFGEQQRLVMIQTMEYGYENEMLEEHIKTIVTKEMMKSIEYRIN